jgi:hypothetical protein
MLLTHPVIAANASPINALISFGFFTLHRLSSHIPSSVISSPFVADGGSELMISTMQPVQDCRFIGRRFTVDNQFDRIKIVNPKPPRH